MSAVKTHTALHPAALSRLGRDEFVDLIPQSQRIFLELFERDYALTRFVAANCAASGDFAEKATPLAIKGGFAIRHCFSGPRFSKDADLVMSDPDLELEGPDLLVTPPRMRIAQTPLADGGESWKIRIRYRMTDGREDSIECDLNGNTRPIRRPPPRRRTFQSRFVEDFDVWVARTEEIIAEKLVALLDYEVDRIRDIFDIRHVLAQPKVVLDAGLTRELLGELLQGPRFVRKRGRIPVEAVSGHVARIAALSDASAAWESQIGKMLPGAQPTLDTAAKECLAGLTGKIFC